jgi:hypothetical protein
MQRMMKKFLWMALLTVGAPAAWGYALLGPIANGGDAWQVVVLGYNLIYLEPYFPGGPVWLGDIGAPKNIGEEYRRNAPVLYYAYDRTFAGFFGTDGEQAVDGAFAIMNSLTNVDSYSASLSEFPLQSQSFNYRAQSAYLTDIKSVTLHLLVEQMGLAEPERYTWTLHDRFLGPACPLTTSYLVVQRNLDLATSPLTQVQYSPYVNGVLYSYYINELCGRVTGIPWRAITVPFPADQLATIYTAVAANNYAGSWGSTFWVGGLQLGAFYTGLTRDDVAGLRYLMRTNNVNWETAAAGSLMQQTNLSTQVPLYTTDLGALLMSSRTNSPATLAALFPGVVVAGSSNYLTVVSNPVVVSYFTNYYGEPVGTAPHLVVRTNGYTYTPTYMYVTRFANVVITTNWFANSYRTNTSARLMTVNVTTQYGAPVGSPLKTNVTFRTVTLTNVPSGDYYLIPPGTCGYSIPRPQPSAGFPIEVVTATTNLITEAINPQGFYYSQSIVTYATNHIFQAFTCDLVPGATGNYQGIQRVQFVRIPDDGVDPLTRNLLQPYWATNYYTMVFYDPTNRQLSTQTFQRVVTAPDILFSAQDWAVGPAGNNFNGTVVRNINFEQGNVLPGLAGPGIIDGQSQFVYNKVGGVYENGPFPSTNSYYFGIGPGTDVNETTDTRVLQWASFDASTNAPILYPNGTSIENYENQIVIGISPATLPDGTNDQDYAVTFTVTGGQPPYTWQMAPGSNPLPDGLVMYPDDGVLAGTPTGNPPGTYDFTIQMHDAAARNVQRSYSINIIR